MMLARRKPRAQELGLHPDMVLREAGELALIDWAQLGGPVVADRDEAVAELLCRTSPARALGAALLAVYRADAALSDDMPWESGLANSSEYMAERAPGGPKDKCLRVALCARQHAMSLLGADGEPSVALDGYNRLRAAPANYNRDEAKFPIEIYDFRRLTAVAYVELTPADRAMLGAP